MFPRSTDRITLEESSYRRPVNMTGSNPGLLHPVLRTTGSSFGYLGLEGKVPPYASTCVVWTHIIGLTLLTCKEATYHLSARFPKLYSRGSRLSVPSVFLGSPTNKRINSDIDS